VETLDWYANGLAIVNTLAFAGVGVWAARTAVRETSQPLRALNWIVVLACSAFLLAAAHHLVLASTWDPASLAWWRLARNLLTFLLAVIVVGSLRRVSVSVRSLERLLAVLSAGGSSELVQVEHRPLTPREVEVCGLIGQGLVSDEAIAAELHISPSTAKTHVRNILAKTGVGSRRAIVLLALREPQPSSEWMVLSNSHGASESGSSPRS
jgi:DNA-binding CsgD family transcriptional regulator